MEKRILLAGILLASPTAGFSPTSRGFPRRAYAAVTHAHGPSDISFFDVVGRAVKSTATPLGIAELCDLEAELNDTGDNTFGTSAGISFTRLTRRVKLERLLSRDRKGYLETAAFLGSRLPRSELPNRQGLGINSITGETVHSSGVPSKLDDHLLLVPDCELANATVTAGLLDRILLSIFRKKARVPPKSWHLIFIVSPLLLFRYKS